MARAFGIEINLGPYEIGPVRFKFGLGAEATVAARAGGPSLGTTASPGHDPHHGGRTTERERSLEVGAGVTIARNITAGAAVEVDPRHLDELIAAPSPRNFVRALLSGFNTKVRFGDDDASLAVELSPDPDFCFFAVRAEFQREALGTRSVSAGGSVEGAIMMGPSRATMQRLALRAGPALVRVLSSAAPRVLPEGSVALSGSGFFQTWAGPIGWAIPISLALRDALTAYTRHLRAVGAERGNANQWAHAFVRETYGQRHPHYSGGHAAVARGGIETARALASQHGWVHLQARLERDYNHGRPPRLTSPYSGIYDYEELNRIADRFGEAIYRSRYRGDAPPATLSRY